MPSSRRNLILLLSREVLLYAVWKPRPMSTGRAEKGRAMLAWCGAACRPARHAPKGFPRLEDGLRPCAKCDAAVSYARPSIRAFIFPSGVFMRFKTLALASALAATLFAPAQAQTEIQWWHSMTGRQRRMGQRPGQAVQREPEGLQGRADLQGHLRRIDDGRHRGLPRRQRAAHPAGVRGRHRHHDGHQGRHHAGRPRS